jgi:cell division protein FtsL
MIKSAIFFCLVLSLSIFGLFQIKYKVQDLRKDLAELRLQLSQEKEEIHILGAEWTYLNQPDRIKRLATLYLKLEPMKIAQMHQLTNELPVMTATITAKNKIDREEMQLLSSFLPEANQNNSLRHNVKWNYKKGKVHSLFAKKNKDKPATQSVNFNKQKINKTK